MATEVTAPVTGTVWKIEKRAGDAVAAGEPVMILESMKMEVPVESPATGTVTSLTRAEGDPVEEGDVVAIIE